MSKTSNDVSTFKIAATYMGTVLGAGFASGQEIFQFFGIYGKKGLIGILLITLFFILYGYIIMHLGYTIKSPSYIEIIRLSGGKYFGIVIDVMICFFLFSSVAAMVAASGALFSQQFGFHHVFGGILMTALTIVTVFMGMNGLINSLSIIIPVLLTVAVGTSITSLIPSAATQLPHTIAFTIFEGNWLVSAILYVSYNIVTAIAVLGPLGKEARDEKSIRNGSILGGLALGVCAFTIYMTVHKNIDHLSAVELPMIYIAGRISPVVQAIYSIVLFASIFSTSAGCLYGFTARVLDPKSRLGLILIPVIALLAFVAGQFGFSNLVKYMYPVEGYLGIVLLVSLVYSKIKLRTPQ